MIPSKVDYFRKSSSHIHRILVVGNENHRSENRLLLEDQGYIVHEAQNGFDALSILNEIDFDVVLIDQGFTGMKWVKLCEYIHKMLDLPHLSVLLVTENHIDKSVIDCLHSSSFDFIREPFDTEELLSRIEISAQKKFEADQFDNVESVLFALARMVEAKDKSTGDHCSRLEHTATVFGHALGLKNKDLTALRRGSVLHDIGKIAIPSRILMKPGALTGKEWEIIQHHPKLGMRLCSGLKSMRLAMPIIAYHHERMDGSGYPFGLIGEKIPFLARVFQCLDIYDALSNERPYKGSFSSDEIINIFNQEVAKGWRDPELVATFTEILSTRPDDLILPENQVMDDGELIYQEILTSGILN